ncbi:hypothetical protein AHAS_Ahas03G0007700 [Arachis hypogaea]
MSRGLISWIGMSSLRPELHVAQQIRRDKLRFQNLQQDFPTNLEEQISLHQQDSRIYNMLQDVEQPPPQQQSLYYASSSPQQQRMINNNCYYYSGNCMVNNFATLSPSVANNHNHIVTVAHYSSSQQNSSSSSSNNNNAALQDILNLKPASNNSEMHHHPYVIDNYTPTAAAAGGWNNHHQGLSLSLSSSSPLNVHVKSSTTTNPMMMMKPSTTSPASSSYYYRNSVGPLGPFTGYATILKSSRFLKPCQKLLDEYCRRHSAPSTSEWPSTTTCADDDDDNDDDRSDHGLLVSEKGGGSSSNNNNNVGAAGSSSSSSMFHAPSSSSPSRPECQKNKAKLLFMQEEVTRRYKQYHQQMQMVVSSFETVAGLNSATPYVSLALKLVSKNFKSLKNSISGQLKLICQALGEDYPTMPPAPASTSNRFESNMARLQRNKPGGGGGNMDFEPQQHVWRPQRGLPERAVAILKSWLFEHFLHPYPTDTDKHMLATQTGLSRNQVSNWFINARVRVWKPMVEEIHMLETKGANQISSNRMGEGNSASNESSNHAKVLVDQPLAISERQIRCLEMGSSSSSLANDEEVQWSQEKRSKLECMDGTLMGLMPFRGAGVGVGAEVRGLGPVSLTLELRHGVEGSQQQQQEEQLRHHFGGHMIHDFVG